MKRIAITSLAPGHKNYANQLNAVKSWIEHGFKVISVNHPDEIKALQNQFKDVEFVETIRTNERIFKKPYVLISAIIDYLKTRKEESFLLINSDIIMYDSWNILEDTYEKAKKGIVVLNRYDYEKEFDEGVKLEGGFDAFILPRKHLNIFPQSILCLGQCFWDYWLPYHAVLAKVPLLKPTKALLFHKKHDVQYSASNYQTTAMIFRSEVGAIDPNIKQNATSGQMSLLVFNQIIKNLK